MEEFRLPTPEAVDIEYDLAGIGTRFLAAALDTLIIAGLLLIIGIGALALGHFGDWPRTAALILATTLVFVLIWGYYIIFETVWNGQTPGKRGLKIRVIKTSGYPIGFVEAAIRNLVRYVDFLPGFYGLGVVVMFISRQSRRLGDYAAGTMVVKERSPVDVREVLKRSWQVTPPLTALQPRGAVDPEEFSWDLEALTSDDLTLIGEYLERAPSLNKPVRQRIGANIAERICARIQARPPLDPVRFLERVVYLRDSTER